MRHHDDIYVLYFFLGASIFTGTVALIFWLIYHKNPKLALNLGIVLGVVGVVIAAFMVALMAAAASSQQANVRRGRGGSSSGGGFGGGSSDDFGPSDFGQGFTGIGGDVGDGGYDGGGGFDAGGGDRG
jgi:hypothetical protein